MISRRITPRRPERRFISALAILGLIAGSLITNATALAVHQEGLFELDTNSSSTICNPLPAPCGDANTADSPAGSPDDWDNVYKSFSGQGTAGPDHAFGRAFITDPVSSAENSFYTGGGSKDERDIPSWQYGTTNDVVPDKDDLSHAFAAAYTKASNSNTIIYFGVDRYDNSGDAETGFWFFKGKVSLGANGAFNGIHQVGDVLVLADWGGSNPVGQITVYQWVGGKNPLALVSDNATADCSNIGAGDNVCAVVNRQSVSPAWTFGPDKGGSSSIRPLELFEAGINVTQLFGSDRCFSSFLASTRSSHSTTAQLKDFALGSFEQCGAAITISPSGVNEVGTNHTFTVTVTKTVGASTVGVAGVNPVVTLTPSSGPAITPSSNTCATTGTNASGQCTVTFTSSTARSVTGHATATVVIGGETFNVATDGVAPNSGDAVKQFVDANVSVTPSAVNEVGHQHIFNVSTTAFPAGATPTLISITPNVSPAPSSQSTTCGSPSGSGNTRTCTITINSSTPGVFTANVTAVWSFAVTSGTPSSVTVTRSTSGNSGPSGTGSASKRFVDAYIVINPPEATNTVGDPHTFTVTVFKDDGLPAGATGGDSTTGWEVATVGNVDVTLANDATSNFALDAASSTCDDAQPSGDNLDNNGQCTTVFTSSTAGTVTGHATVTLVVGGVTLTRSTDGTAPNSGDAIKHFVAGALKWTKVDNAGALQGGATFTVCKTQNYNLVTGMLEDITPVCVDILDNQAGPPADADGTNGKFQLNGLSLGTYCVTEKTAPAGFVKDPDTECASLIPNDTDKTISTAFVNTREVLKITGFGYTNAPTGTPTSGVVSGTTTFTVNLHNYGSAAANLTNSSLVVSANKTAGTVTCNGTGTDGLNLALTGSIAAGANGGPYVLVCTYTGLNDGATISANLVVKSTTNGLEREASGSPALIRLTIQSD